MPQSLTPSSDWLTGRPPIAAPWCSVVVARRRGTGGTGGRGGDSAKPLELQWVMDRWMVSCLDGSSDGWSNRETEDGKVGGSIEKINV